MATIRITARGKYVVLVDEPHPDMIGKLFDTFQQAASYCGYKHLPFICGWLDLA